jgi:hypothetical protein
MPIYLGSSDLFDNFHEKEKISIWCCCQKKMSIAQGISLIMVLDCLITAFEILKIIALWGFYLPEEAPMLLTLLLPGTTWQFIKVYSKRAHVVANMSCLHEDRESYCKTVMTNTKCWMYFRLIYFNVLVAVNGYNCITMMSLTKDTQYFVTNKTEFNETKLWVIFRRN